jgi:hypothetical protein
LIIIQPININAVKILSQDITFFRESAAGVSRYRRPGLSRIGAEFPKNTAFSP